MLSYHLKISSYLFILVALLTYSCADPSVSDVRIERFEKLDEQPRIECYLVYGYHPSIEREIGLMLDKFVCDSIFPHVTIDPANDVKQKLFSFYKKTKNSNNKETYRSDMKRAIADRDIIFEYVFRIDETSIIVPDHKRYKINDPDMVIEPFTCK